MTTTAGTWHDQLLEPAHRADLLLAEMTTAESVTSSPHACRGR